MLGIEQSKKSEVIAYSSILLFHDSLDMFVQLAAQHKGVAKKQKTFLKDYFTLIPELTMGASVLKINDRRNSLKHNGQIPAKIEVEESAVICKLFFEQNTESIFGIDFNEVSLYNLVSFTEVRNLLLLHETLISKKDFSGGISELAKAFGMLMKIYDKAKRQAGWRHMDKLHAGNQMMCVWDSAGFGRSSNLVGDSTFKRVLELYDKHFQRIEEEFGILGSGVVKSGQR